MRFEPHDSSAARPALPSLILLCPSTVAGLSPVPPLMVWLGNATCVTAMHPTPASNGGASAVCPLPAGAAFAVDPFIVTWMTQV